MTRQKTTDVLIIGAGPAGAIAGALINKLGHSCQIVERESFPRFSIGESLLPQSMEFIEQADMLEAVRNGNFQAKNGARFLHRGSYTEFNFTDKFSEGWSTTFEVTRANFDKILADEAQSQGVLINYGQTISDVDIKLNDARVTAYDGAGNETHYAANFVLDASGFGRVLPRLLALDKPANFPRRRSMFTHILDNINDAKFDRNKILITIHPEKHDIWYWLIPFSGGRSSVGVVAEESQFASVDDGAEDALRQLINAEPDLRCLLGSAEFDMPINSLTGYASNVSQMHGPGYALLGNAGEFLDPIFSSGVTIAMKSASLAAVALDRQLRGEIVDWTTEFSSPLAQGVGVFRAFVEAWYDGSLQDIFFSDFQEPRIKQMICSILAGYAWDLKNPYNSRTSSRLKTLSKLCKA